MRPGPDKYDVIYCHYIATFTLSLRFSALYLGRSDLRKCLGVTRSHLGLYFLFTIGYRWICKVKHISRLVILLSFPFGMATQLTPLSSPSPSVCLVLMLGMRNHNHELFSPFPGGRLLPGNLETLNGWKNWTPMTPLLIPAPHFLIKRYREVHCCWHSSWLWLEGALCWQVQIRSSWTGFVFCCFSCHEWLQQNTFLINMNK